MLLAGMMSMAYGTWLGLVRIGWNLPLPSPDDLIGHGPLMVCGFLGTLISLERSVALGSPWGAVAALCPALMLFFLLRVTGIPATEEQALRSRGEDYRRYQRTTSAFVPWFPKT